MNWFPRKPPLRDHLFELGVQQDVRKRDAGDGDPPRRQRRADLCARQLTSVERLLQHITRAGEHAGVEPDFWRISRHRPLNARSGQHLHPANVGRRDEVPGRPQDVRAQDFAAREGGVHRGAVESARAQAERPPRSWIVLRLDSAEPRHDLARLPERRRREALVVQASPERHVSAGLIRPIGRSVDQSIRRQFSCRASMSNAAMVRL